MGCDLLLGSFCKQSLLLLGSILSLKNNPISISDVKKHLGLFVLKCLRLLKKHINIIKQFVLMWLNFEPNRKV